MSTNNIIDVQLSGLSVDVTFKVHGEDGQRTYRYFDLEAVRGILAGEDPSQWSGELVDRGSAGGGSAAGALSTDIAEIGEIADL